MRTLCRRALTALVQQAMRTMMVTKLKVAGAAALIVGVLTCVATALAAVGPLGRNATEALSVPGESRALAIQDATRAGEADRAKAAGVQQESVILHGRVLGPDGKPVSGAMIYTFSPKRGRPISAVQRPKAGEDGKFQFDVSRAEIDAIAELSPFASLMVVATAPGLGPDLVEVREPPEGELSLRPVDDSVPITGRIVDLQGKPVAGAKITRGRIKAATAETGIDPFLTLVRDDPMQASNYRFCKYYWEGFELPGQPASLVTDADGRFRLSGIGRDRIVDLSVEGATIQSATIEVITRAGVKVSSPPGTFAGQTIYPANFEHFIPPGRALTGVVRDKKTQSPMAGVEVCGHETNARTKTDEHGRYTLVVFPTNKGPGVRSGLVGATPNLCDLEDGDVKMSVDFRRVYASVLEGWLGVSSEAALGGAFEKLPLFRFI